MTYAIYEELFPEVDKKLQRVAKKCIKHGNAFTYEIKGTEIRAIEDKETWVIKDKQEVHPVNYYKFILVEVEGTAKIDNWECIAVLEIHDMGNIIRRINTEIVIPERFKTSDNICEHCNSKRHRKNLYVIHNTDTDEWKQVGGDCLKLYTGGLNLEYVVAWLDGITELEENDGFIGGGSKCYYPVDEVLGAAVEVIEKLGYYNRESNLPTKDLVTILMRDTDLYQKIIDLNKELRLAKLDVYFERKDFYREETMNTVKLIIEYYTSLEADTEFIHNIQIMLNEGYVEIKNFGFLSYLPEGYNKYLKIEVKKAEKEKARANEKSEYFGEIGKRYKDKAIQSINRLTSWETQWGTTHIYKIVIEDGSVLTWKSSTGLYLERNEEFDKITFTVKNHTEYKGQKQTEITRCKVTKKAKEIKESIEDGNNSVDDAVNEFLAFCNE